MSNYMITISYDGTSYKGWQIQKNTSDTIQGKLEHILSTLAGEPINVNGSGRTDAGVHAIEQVANFHMNLPVNMTEDDLLLYMNKYLPEDIAVKSLVKVDSRFHARLSAVSKTYRYRIHVSPIANVFEKKYVYTYLDSPLNIEAMKKAASYLLGEHDFIAFCGNRHMKKSSVRTITDINFNLIEDNWGLKEIQIEYTGNGFLQNMIRIITGTLIEVGTNRRTPESIIDTLNSLNRDNAGYTAPSQGLCLVKVYY